MYEEKNVEKNSEFQIGIEHMTYEEKNVEKNSEFQIRIEHMTFQTLVRCSNDSATGNYSVKQVNIILG